MNSFKLFAFLAAFAASTASAQNLLGGEPLSTAEPHFKRRPHDVNPGPFWGDLAGQGPLPTNRWWFNIVYDNGSLPLMTHPYTLKVWTDGLHASLPTKVKD